ncbi:hypothetical protein VTK73DRAFT_5847 [Phialemonium thermophilum]|uniref:SET domain-containing protein n=1 Tax=Phialemonium thermophilum TaxID=223376 RepID=A0ABR3WLW7_9PEZI
MRTSWPISARTIETYNPRKAAVGKELAAAPGHEGQPLARGSAAELTPPLTPSRTGVVGPLTHDALNEEAKDSQHASAGGLTPDPSSPVAVDTRSPSGAHEDQETVHCQGGPYDGPKPMFMKLPPAGVVFRNESFEVRPSPLGGLGAFAVRDLKFGERILAEAPLLRSTCMNLFRDFEKLDPKGKETYMSLHGFSPKEEDHPIEKIRRANSFEVPGGFAIFPIASRFNHACKPIRNTMFFFDTSQQKLVLMVATVSVPSGSELLLNYGGCPEQLLYTWGFRCRCTGCEYVLSEEQVRAMTEAIWSS